MNSRALSEYSLEEIHVTSEFPLESATLSNPEATIAIIDSDISLDISTIRTFIESNLSISKVIFTSNANIENNEVENFTVSGISYREYAE
jgi:hypothetical protein